MWLQVLVFVSALVVSQAGDFCAGRCGGRSLDGSCDCTEDCGKNGSCCWDFQYACFVAGNFSSNLKCQGRCGWPNLDWTSCNCTEDCEETGSCCWDFQITCNSSGVFSPDRQCEGRCGGPSLDGSCNCTEDCGETNSCCWDIQMTCNATEVFIPDNPICAVNATLLRNPGESCENRCGKRRAANGGLYINIFNAQINFDQCSCDVYCGFQGDCCHDFNQTCPQQFEEFQGLVEQYPITYNVSDFACLDWLPSLVIHTCPDGSECDFAPGEYDNKNTFLPVYDVHRGIHYVSGQCAVCNGATEVEPWDFKLRCNYHDNDDSSDSGSGSDSTDLGDNISCKEEYNIASDKQRPCFYLSPDDYVIDFCDTRCANPQLKSLCESGAQNLVRYMGQTYKNIYCSICHASPTGGEIKLTNVTDLDRQNSSEVTKYPPLECAAGEIYVPDEDACQPITCPSGFILDGSDCIPEPSNITLTVSGRFSDVSLVFKKNKTELEKRIRQTVENVVNKINMTYYHLNVTTQIGESNDTVSVTIRIQCNCDKGRGNINYNNFLIAVQMEVRFMVVYLLLNNIHFHPLPGCAAGEVYDPYEEACQPIMCPSGFVLDGSTCIPEVSNITLTVSGRLSHVSLVFTMRNKTELEKRIRQTVENVMNKNNVTYHHMDVTTQISISDDNVSVIIRIRCNCDYKKGSGNINFPNYLIAMETAVRDAVVRYSLRNNVRLHSVHTTRTFV